MEISTKRLRLRSWNDNDYELFAQLNADPLVMKYFFTTLSREESDQMLNRIQAKLDKRGWGLWAVSPLDSSELMGFIGLNDITSPAHLSQYIEVGWRLSPKYWKQGFATEGALACLKYAFETLKLPEIISITAMPNKSSIGVMERIGMHRNPAEDFDHPNLPDDHWLKKHVLYRLTKEEWEKQ